MIDKSYSQSELYALFHCGYCLLPEVWNELLTGVSPIIDDCTLCVCVGGGASDRTSWRNGVWRRTARRQSQLNLNWSNKRLAHPTPISLLSLCVCVCLPFSVTFAALVWYFGHIAALLPEPTVVLEDQQLFFQALRCQTVSGLDCDGCDRQSLRFVCT